MRKPIDPKTGQPVAGIYKEHGGRKLFRITADEWYEILERRGVGVIKYDMNPPPEPLKRGEEIVLVIQGIAVTRVLAKVKDLIVEGSADVELVGA